MQETEQVSIVCPDCGRRYRWRATFAGKELHCKCGLSFDADEAWKQARGGAADRGEDGSAIAGGASDGAAARVDRYAAAFGARSSVEEALARREDEVQPSLWREYYVPMIGVPVGWLIGAMIWWLLCPTWWALLAVLGVVLVLQVCVFVPAKLAAVVTVARWLQLGLGTLGQVLFKGACLTLGPAAAADAMFTLMMVYTDFDWWALAAGYAFYVVIYGLPTAFVYEMNVAETALTVGMVFLPRVAAVYIVALAFNDMFVG